MNNRLQYNPAFLLAGFISIAASISLLATQYYYLSLLPSIGIGITLLLFKKPQIGYYTIIFLMPFGAYRNLWGPLASIKIHWIIAAILVIVMIVMLLSQRRVPSKTDGSLWTYLALFMGVNILAAFQSQYPQSSNHTIIRLALGYLFIVLTLFFMPSDGLRKRLPRIIIYSVSLSALLAVLGFFFKISLFAVDATKGDFVRGTGGTTWASSLSIMIIFTFPLLLHQIFQAKNLKQKVAFSLLAIINLGGMVTTFSRGGAIILIIIITSSLFLYRHRFHSRHLGIVGVVIASSVVIALLTTPASYWQRQKDLTQWQDASIGRRQSYLVVGWKSFLEDPFLGKGPGTFRDIYAVSQWAKIFVKEGKTKRRFAHNTYVEVLVGSGLCGFALFLMLLAKCWRNFSRAFTIYNKRADEYMTTLVGSYQLSFLSLLLYFFLHSGMDNKYLLLILPISHMLISSTKRVE